MAKRPSITNCGAEGLRVLTNTLYAGDPMRLRHELIFAAGVMNNGRLLNDLGSAEMATWHEGRRAANPDYVNPYWPDL